MKERLKEMFERSGILSKDEVCQFLARYEEDKVIDF